MAIKVFRILAVLGLIGMAYFGWARHRLSAEVMMHDRWPRPAPYPDGWLLILNNWYDVRHPAAPGTLKLESEWDRVYYTVSVAISFSTSLFLIGAVPVGLRFIPRSGGRAFEVLPRNRDFTPSP